jgi:hypothetical protein
MIARRGLSDITDRSDATLWMCAFPPFSLSSMCAVAPAGAPDSTNYGGALSPASQAAQQAAAAAALANDCATHPELYTLVPGSCSYAPNGSGMDWTPAILIGAGVLLLFSLGGMR